jgi:putative SOS response-associated peptidase YedK
MGLEDLYVESSDDIAPGSMQPVVYLHSSGERAIALMLWGFKTPDRLLFNTHSETVATANFWKDSFLKRRCLVPADGFYECVQPCIFSDPLANIGELQNWSLMYDRQLVHNEAL